MSLRAQAYGCLLAAIFFVSLGYYISHHTKPSIQSFNETTVISTPRDMPKIAFESNTGSFTPENFKGHWSWVFFGFTRCQQLCPTTLQQMHQAYEKLAELGAKNIPEIYMISIDPGREDIKEVNRYVKSFNRHFTGLKTDDKQLAMLRNKMGVIFVKEAIKNADGSDDYTINHSGTIFILNPEGKIAGFFNMPHDPNAMANEFNIWVG